MVSPKPLSRAGVVSHILRNRTINASTGVKTERWFHYDQVGSVISESDASGALEQTHHQDAFGNTQTAWQTGLWGGDRAGWHHNTKELDGDTGLVYMYQRWYSPETGTFMSSAPYPVTMEHRYGFAENRPVSVVDPDGRCRGGTYDECVRRATADFISAMLKVEAAYLVAVAACLGLAAIPPPTGEALTIGCVALVTAAQLFAVAAAVIDYREAVRRCRVDCPRATPCPTPPPLPWPKPSLTPSPSPRPVPTESPAQPVYV
jgi:RHS repeat-associated protein